MNIETTSTENQYNFQDHYESQNFMLVPADIAQIGFRVLIVIFSQVFSFHLFLRDDNTSLGPLANTFNLFDIQTEGVGQLTIPDILTIFLFCTYCLHLLNVFPIRNSNRS